MIGNLWEWTDEWYAGLGDADVSKQPWPENTAAYGNDGTWNIARAAYAAYGAAMPSPGLPAAALRGGGEPVYHRRGADQMVLTNPSLLFDVLSPSTEEYDRGSKLMLYRQIETLKDVLLIDPESRQVEHHHRGARGWKSTTRKRGAIRILGGSLEVADLFEGL